MLMPSQGQEGVQQLHRGRRARSPGGPRARAGLLLHVTETARAVTYYLIPGTDTAVFTFW